MLLEAMIKCHFLSILSQALKKNHLFYTLIN